MAIARIEVSIVARSHGQSAIAAAAYMTRSALTKVDGTITKNYANKHDLVKTGVMLPPNAPEEYYNRETLWQSVEKIETGSKAQLARKVLLSLPKELSSDEQIRLTEEFIKTAFVDRGMCADWAIHDKGDGNPHAHILLTLRGLDSKGHWMPKKSHEYLLDGHGNRIPDIDKKTGLQKRQKDGAKIWKRVTRDVTDWNQRSMLESWRSEAEKIINQRLLDHGLDTISFKSYEKQLEQALPALENAEKEVMKKENEVKRFNRDVVREQKIRTGKIEREKTWLNVLSMGLAGGITDKEKKEKERYQSYVKEGLKEIDRMNDWQKRQLAAELALKTEKEPHKREELKKIVEMNQEEYEENQRQEQLRVERKNQRRKEKAQQEELERKERFKQEINNIIKKIDEEKKKKNEKDVETARSLLYAYAEHDREYNILSDEDARKLDETIKREKKEAEKERVQKAAELQPERDGKGRDTKSRSASQMPARKREGRDKDWSR